jgi:hypothetical protein
MERTRRRNLIKRLQTELPRGAPFDTAVLEKIGVSAKLAARYAEGGWLVRLGQGVYAFPNDDFSIYGTVTLLQTRVPGLHVGGKSALALQGVRHNLGARELLVLWGDTRFVLPAWFTARFPARYVYAHLFDWPNTHLAKNTLTTPPGALTGLNVAVPERAVLELLYDTGTRQGLEESRHLFESLRNLRIDVLGRILACCTSIKAIRLFLTWARQTNVVDVDALLKQFDIPVGSNKRWMTRLKDGTLLSLQPHG